MISSSRHFSTVKVPVSQIRRDRPVLAFGDVAGESRVPQRVVLGADGQTVLCRVVGRFLGTAQLTSTPSCSRRKS